MTNFRSFAGSLVWAAIAGVLMLATFEPISLDSGDAPVAAHQSAL